jgi:nicotinamide-nucleotide amidase
MTPANALARDVLFLAREKGVMIATAESCTGGLVSATLTEIAGSSAVVDRGFVTYSNASKQELLGVRPETLERFGAVSMETAREMASGALARSQAQLAVSITGIAGPGGESASKPVGLVWFGVAQVGRKPRTLERRFGDVGRSKVRRLSVETALTALRAALR